MRRYRRGGRSAARLEPPQGGAQRKGDSHHRAAASAAAFEAQTTATALPTCATPSARATTEGLSRSAARTSSSVRSAEAAAARPSARFGLATWGAQRDRGRCRARLARGNTPFATANRGREGRGYQAEGGYGKSPSQSRLIACHRHEPFGIRSCDYLGIRSVTRLGSPGGSQDHVRLKRILVAHNHDGTNSSEIVAGEGTSNRSARCGRQLARDMVIEESGSRLTPKGRNDVSAFCARSLACDAAA